MIIDFEVVLLEMYNYTKRQNSFSTDAMAAQASKVPLQLVDESDNEWQVERSQRRAARHNAHVPRRACAARVTVVVLCVCLSVCLFVCLFVCLSATILVLQATRRLMDDTNSFSATRARKRMWRFP